MESALYVSSRTTIFQRGPFDFCMEPSFPLAIPCQEHLDYGPGMFMGITPKAGVLSSGHVPLPHTYLFPGWRMNSPLFHVPCSSCSRHSPSRCVLSFSLSHPPPPPFWFSPPSFSQQVWWSYSQQALWMCLLWGLPPEKLGGCVSCLDAYFYSGVCPAADVVISPSKGPLSGTSRRMLLYWLWVRQPGSLWRNSWMKLDNFH